MCLTTDVARKVGRKETEREPRESESLGACSQRRPGGEPLGKTACKLGCEHSCAAMGLIHAFALGFLSADFLSNVRCKTLCNLFVRVYKNESDDGVMMTSRVCTVLIKKSLSSAE